MTPSNDTPTDRTSSAPERSNNSTAAAIICDADHNSEVLFLKGEMLKAEANQGLS